MPCWAGRRIRLSRSLRPRCLFFPDDRRISISEQVAKSRHDLPVQPSGLAHFERSWDLESASEIHPHSAQAQVPRRAITEMRYLSRQASEHSICSHKQLGAVSRLDDACAHNLSCQPQSGIPVIKQGLVAGQDKLGLADCPSFSCSSKPTRVRPLIVRECALRFSRLRLKLLLLTVYHESQGMGLTLKKSTELRMRDRVMFAQGTRRFHSATSSELRKTVSCSRLCCSFG
ncbi:hypothetical protein VTI74DRAFT_10237 [Chaetomium olivicolor]